jgi:hypothetical protein
MFRAALSLSSTLKLGARRAPAFVEKRFTTILCVRKGGEVVRSHSLTHSCALFITRSHNNQLPTHFLTPLFHHSLTHSLTHRVQSMGGDGQVTAGSVVIKPNVQKVRRLGDGIVVGFAGSTADALTLFERLEDKLTKHPDQLMRACVELAKAWRTDKYLRKLEVS